MIKTFLLNYFSYKYILTVLYIMRKSVISICLLVQFIIFINSVNAQNDWSERLKAPKISMHVGTSIPLSAFADATISEYHDQPIVVWNPFLTNVKDGGAGSGFNLGVKVKFDIFQLEGLGVILSTDLLEWNNY